MPASPSEVAVEVTPPQRPSGAACSHDSDFTACLGMRGADAAGLPSQSRSHLFSELGAELAVSFEFIFYTRPADGAASLSSGRLAGQFRP